MEGENQPLQVILWPPQTLPYALTPGKLNARGPRHRRIPTPLSLSAASHLNNIWLHLHPGLG